MTALTSVSSLSVAATLPRNDEVADQLELLADLSELEGEDSFRVLAYRRAATRIRETGGPVAQLALEGKAKALSGIGKTIEEKIVQIVETGEMAALTKRKALVPEEVVKFMRLPGLGPKTDASRGACWATDCPFCSSSSRSYDGTPPR